MSVTCDPPGGCHDGQHCNWHEFHRQWTRAVGGPLYDKQEWRDLEARYYATKRIPGASTEFMREASRILADEHSSWGFTRGPERL